MNARRHFLKLASVAAMPMATIASAGEVHEDNRDTLVGTWSSIHTLPFPPDSFREFLSFSEGGVLHETNSFLHSASNLDFSAFGLPNVVNASDGFGNWVRAKHGQVQAVFRKMLFNGSRQNFADLLVSGTLRTDEGKLYAEWQIQVVDLQGAVAVDFGPATSEGVRLS